VIAAPFHGTPEMRLDSNIKNQVDDAYLGVDHFVILLHIMGLPLQHKSHSVLVPLL
jgi:hypothetical protein